MKAREYKTTDGRYAIVREHPCGVLVEVEDGDKLRICPDMAKAVEWLAIEYSMAWIRTNRYEN